MSLTRLEMAAEVVTASLEHITNLSVLDVGAREGALKKVVPESVEYYGVDLEPGPDIFSCDLRQPLPFKDGQFDIVCALDVLEHLDDPHSCFSELLRIAKHKVVISLPNMFYFEFRLRFFVGGGISGKYRFSSEPLIDRHRWVLSFSEAIEFVDANSSDWSVAHFSVVPRRGRTRHVVEPCQRALARLWPNLFAYGTLSVISRPGSRVI